LGCGQSRATTHKSKTRTEWSAYVFDPWHLVITAQSRGRNAAIVEDGDFDPIASGDLCLRRRGLGLSLRESHAVGAELDDVWIRPLAGLCKEFRFSQPDIIKIGRFYAVVLAIFFNTVFIVLTFSFALKKYAFMLAYSKQGFVTAWHAYQALAGYLGRSFIFFTQVATSPLK